MVDQIAIAVSSPKNYKHLTKLKTGRIIGFLVIISFLLTFIEFGINAIVFVAKVGGFENLALNKIPAFTYEDGKLNMADDMQLAVGDAIIYVDTTKDRISLSDIKEDGMYIAMGKENLVLGIISNGKPTEYMSYGLSLLFPFGFNNEALAGYAPLFYIYIIMMYIITMIAKTAKIMIFALFLSLLGRMVSNAVHMSISYGKILAICIYAVTLPMMLASVNVTLGYIISPSILIVINSFIAFTFINRGLMSHMDKSVPPNGVN